jgi:Lon-like ATP-dependent protease
MSGEISLSGKILKVGGLKEKIILAVENNIKKLYLPLENKNDVLEYLPIYDQKIDIQYVDNYIEIYNDLFKKRKKQ